MFLAFLFTSLAFVNCYISFYAHYDCHKEGRPVEFGLGKEHLSENALLRKFVDDPAATHRAFSLLPFPTPTKPRYPVTNADGRNTIGGIPSAVAATALKLQQASSSSYRS